MRRLILAFLLAACTHNPSSSGGASTAGSSAEGEEPSTAVAVAIGADERIEKVPTRPGVVLPVLVGEPARTPSGIVVLFPGGNGLLKLGSGRIEQGADNLMVRTRRRFVEQGYVAVVVDAPSDHPEGVGDYRIAQDEAADVARLLAWTGSHWAGAPTWLVGTSRGTISAANAAARGARPHGLVLTSSVTAGPREKLSDVPLDRIDVPTFVVHNHLDGCKASPFEGGRRLEKALEHAPAKAFLAFDRGSEPRSGPCGPLSYHGFYGLDAEVVASIVEFIEAH
jgi:alpha/beta superfamily hydrolase